MATLNYSPAQQTQLIEFYQQWLPRVNAFGYDNLPDGYHTYYRHGKKLAKAAAAAKIVEAKAARRRGNPYLRPEVEFIVHSYVRTDSPSIVADEFKAAFIDSPHSRESVRSCAGQLRSLDNLCPDDTGWTVKSLVAEVASELYPERFAA
ncbi:hypothetical protein S420910_112 [Synechococcus phage S-CAM7]|uniref:Uncharacterized protein n=1 Tax=Synechococcus phage S-CAM7 TaxID=1883368 RepID=A0A1D8KUE7_9CAUD|nr:hypothetical protein S420910_112 [Synechococcus phage S-CAM7]